MHPRAALRPVLRPALRAVRTAARRLAGPEPTPPPSPAQGRRSYAQCGEDLILDFLLHELRVETPTYVDLGAHHPFFLNNTALLYENGGRGVNVEPDPALIGEFTEHRPGDVNLGVGVGSEPGTLDLHVMSSPTLNTFSAEEAARAEKHGYTVTAVVPVEVLTPEEIFGRLLSAAYPDVLSIDVEGLDLEIARATDLVRFPVPVICAETISHDRFGHGTKNTALVEHLQNQGYTVYADTYINTIFVRQSFFDERTGR